MSDRRRCDEQPGLHKAALAACTTRLTDGFCTPNTRDVCRCWDAAEAAQRATGMSAQAVAWVFNHRSAIEREAAKLAGNDPALDCAHSQGHDS